MAPRNPVFVACVAGALAMTSAAVQAQIVYSQNFDALASLAAGGFTTEDLNGSTVWELTTGTNKSARVDFDDVQATDDWLITPAISMTAGNTYVISYVITGGGGSVYDEADVFIAQSATPATSLDLQGGTLLADYNFFAATELTANTSPTRARLTFTPTATGDHYLGFHGKSVADQNFVQIDEIEVFDATTAPPEKATVIFPAAGATNVNRSTHVLSSDTPSAESVTIRVNSNPALLGDPASIILNNSSTLLYGAPAATLAANTLYHARVDTTNTNGTTVGDVFTFTTRPVPTTAGALYFEEFFTGPHSIAQPALPNPPVVRVNPKYASLPGGWAGLDVDGLLNGSGFVATDGWYVTAGALSTRYNQSGAANDDWAFFPPITTNATLPTVMQIDMRVRSASFPETIEVYFQTANPTSTNPADYTALPANLLATETLTNTSYATKTYNLPLNATGRFALRYVSVDQSQAQIDNVRAAIFAPPSATQLAFPVNGATNVNRSTFLHATLSPLATSYTIRLAANPADIGLPSSILVNNSSTVFHAAPPLLAGNTTYHARVDATNTNGTTIGPVTTFTTRPVATAVGDVVGSWDFEQVYSEPTTPVANAGYPAVPRGFDQLDVDLETTANGYPASWFIIPTTRARGGTGSAIMTRYNSNGNANDDWVFLPEVVVPPGLNGEVEFWGRPRFASAPETIEVYRSTTGTNSTNPVDYTLVDTIIDPATDTTYDQYFYSLPSGTTSRLALRYVSVFQSQYLIDDMTIRFVAGPLQNGDSDGDGSINAADVTAIYNFLGGITGAPAGDADVNNVDGVTAADAVLLVDHLVNGTPLP